MACQPEVTGEDIEAQPQAVRPSARAWLVVDGYHSDGVQGEVKLELPHGCLALVLPAAAFAWVANGLSAALVSFAGGGTQPSRRADYGMVGRRNGLEAPSSIELGSCDLAAHGHTAQFGFSPVVVAVVSRDGTAVRHGGGYLARRDAVTDEVA